MKLHEDKFAFLNIINLIHEASGIRSDILGKHRTNSQISI